MVHKDKDTLVVNLYGGPGTGKSTNAAGLFYYLKTVGVDCEMAREYAKDLVWEERTIEFSNQLCILGKQVKRLESLIGKVDAIITDCPILLSGYYNTNYNKDTFNELMLETQKRYNTLDIFLVRTKKYNPNGRTQNEQEANNVSNEIKNYLYKIKVPYKTVTADKNCVDNIVKLIKEKRPELF